MTRGISSARSGELALVGTSGAILLSLITGYIMAEPALARIALASSASVFLVAFAVSRPSLAIYLLVGWLALLGLLRRLATGLDLATVPPGDPLLLTAPLVLTILFVLAVQREGLRASTGLARSVLALTLVLALSAINPLQGGLGVGLGGTLLVVVPMLAFWAGRTFLDDRMVIHLAYLLGGLALIAAAYGLVQTFLGMSSWDRAWAVTEGYASLKIGDAIRPFGISTSASEYATLLGIGIICWTMIGVKAGRVIMGISFAALASIALWFAAVRGMVILTLLGLWLTTSALYRKSVKHAVLGGVVLIALLPTLVDYIAPNVHDRGAAASLSSHQAEGLSEPFGQASTLGSHMGIVSNALGEMVDKPLGSGVGATTAAAERFGKLGPTGEGDPATAPVAAGIPGLLLYLLVAVFGLRAAYHLARTRGNLASLVVVGILVCTVGQWLNGGQYMVIVTTWLLLGWVDRASQTEHVGRHPSTS